MLTSVQLSIKDPDGGLSKAQPDITIREAALNDLNPSNTALYTMTYPGTLTTGTKTFVAPADATLAANTHYFVHIANNNTRDNQRFGVEVTQVNSNDSWQ